MLVQIIKNYDDSCRPYSPDQKMIWDEITFSEDIEQEADFVVVLNSPKKSQKIRCNPDNIIAIMQEPYIEGDTDWMNNQLEKYKYIFTSHTPNPMPKNTTVIKSHGALHWYVQKTYDELKSMTNLPAKSKDISCIASSLTRWPGHKTRVSFIDYLKENNDLKIDFYGKGTQFLEDKWDGIAPYKYSIAIENSSMDDYWTEKLSDVFLSYSLPFYFGCRNIDKYFPSESYIWIDITNPEQAMLTMKTAIENNEYEKRLEYIEKARELVLDKYNLFPFVADFIKKLPIQEKKEKIVIKKYKYSFKEKTQRYLKRKLSRIQKIQEGLKRLF